jgi:hypothetical protein
MPSADVIHLRALLTEKFPGLRLHLDETTAEETPSWPTGLRQIDEPLRGGLSKGAISEFICGPNNHGSSTLIRALLQQAVRLNQITALIDGSDSLDVTQIHESVLSRLLWVRCQAAEEALKAADLILRDGNLPLVLIDLKGNSEKELRKIPATLWYRFQRLVEETSTTFILFASRSVAVSAQTRITLYSQFSLAALDRETGELISELKMDIADARQYGRTTQAQKIA